MKKRELYFVEVDPQDRAAVGEACRTLVKVLGSALERGWIDGYSDFSLGELDQAALTALGELQERASAQAERKSRGETASLMGIELDLTKDEDRQILRAFGPWSIHAEVHSGEPVSGMGESVLSFHDSGSGITAELTEEEAKRVLSMLPDGAALSKVEARGRRPFLPRLLSRLIRN